MNPNPHYLSNEEVAEIQNQLEQIAVQLHADLVLLLDASGQELSAVGKVAPMQLELLSALSAAQLGASQELARALKLNSSEGSIASHIWIIYEGTPYKSYICALGHYILFLLLPTEKSQQSSPDSLTPHLNQLLKLLKEDKHDGEQGGQESLLMPNLTTNIIDSIDLMWLHS